ncbi:MAG TPA: DUF2950 domain-containing protein [Candidatus Binataceae bacterium]|nr:DUF2950 domain-containing protein [Candidatus Binataceae bacterium]
MERSLDRIKAAFLFRLIIGAAIVANALSIGGYGLAQAPNQKTFKTPDEAVTAMVKLLKERKFAKLGDLLGIKENALGSGDKVADKNDIALFLRRYREMHRFANGPDGKYYLIVGAVNWPMPVPLAKSDAGWYFDGKYGAEELHYRRIGRDELDAIRICQEIVRAQKKYYSQTHDGVSNQYAQKLESSAGKQDGLYRESSVKSRPGQGGALLASASEQGYSSAASGNPQEYYGYFYKLLSAQGANAPGGAKDYIQNGKMTGGFAVIAYPVDYRKSGVMTFMADADGQVYEKDLGPNTSSIAAGIKAFDPDKSWHKVAAK